MKILYVINPIAGGGRAQPIWERLCAAHPEIREHACMTRAPQEAETLAAQAESRGYEGVVAVGGDGTLHEVINGIYRTGAKLAVGHIPCGTGNDFARSYGLPRDPEAAWRNLTQGRAVPIDLGMIGDRVFINVAGFGFDAAVAAEVAKRTVGSKGRGALPYLIAVLKLLRTYRPQPMTVSIDGEQTELPIFFGAIGNGSTYGGGMRICPTALCDDGTFHVCLAGDFTPIEALANLLKVFWGGHISHAKCTYRTAREVTIEGPPDVLVHADGQMIGGLPISFRILPQAIRLLTRETTSRK